MNILSIWGCALILVFRDCIFAAAGGIIQTVWGGVSSLSELGVTALSCSVMVWGSGGGWGYIRVVAGFAVSL